MIENPQVPFAIGSIEAVSAIYSNIVSIGINPYYVRLTFGEGVGTTNAMARAAVALALPDAKALADGILNALAQMQPEVEQRTTEATDL
jgi:hypothetical protein